MTLLPLMSRFSAATRMVAVPYGTPPTQNDFPVPSGVSVPLMIGGA